MEHARLIGVSRLVVALAAVMLVTGIVGIFVGPEPATRTTWLGIFCLTYMVAVYGFHLTRWVGPRSRPWRDDGRRVLWIAGLVLLLVGLSFWLSAIYG